MDDYISVGIHAAREAGALLKEYKERAYAVREKADASLVTEADAGAEGVIIQTIGAAFPYHSILSEEAGLLKKDSETGDDFLWIIDPIDGTHNYIQKIPLYGISIGLVRNGEFFGGIIYLPETGELYTAQKGDGAYKNGKRISVSRKDALRHCCLSFDSNFRSDMASKATVLHRIGREVFNIRMFGSSAVSLAYCAEGRLDLVLEFDDKPWDFAAGASILTEAGGAITGLYGAPADYNTVGYIASNGLIQEKFVSIVSNSISIP